MSLFGFKIKTGVDWRFWLIGVYFANPDYDDPWSLIFSVGPLIVGLERKK